MRKIFLATLLLWASTAFGVTYEVRSDKYALTLDVDENKNVHARVVDRVTEAVVMMPSFQFQGPAHRESLVVGDRTLNLDVNMVSGRVTASLEIVENGTTVDSLSATWRLSPQRPESLPGGLLRVGGDVKAPVVIERVNPRFPEEARVNRVAGIVIVEVIVDRTGIVKDGKILKTLPFGLGEAALDAVRQWKFEPGTLHGEPVDVIFNLTVNFRGGHPDE